MSTTEQNELVYLYKELDLKPKKAIVIEAPSASAKDIDQTYAIRRRWPFDLLKTKNDYFVVKVPRAECSIERRRWQIKVSAAAAAFIKRTVDGMFLEAKISVVSIPKIGIVVVRRDVNHRAIKSEL